MIRRLRICNDGTWNSPGDEDRGKRKPTNISKISRAIRPVNSSGVSQIVFYDEGVGNEYLSYYVGFSDSELRESMTLKYRVLGEHIRPITQNDDSNQMVDSSVYDRIKKLDDYKPENIPI